MRMRIVKMGGAPVHYFSDNFYAIQWILMRQKQLLMKFNEI